MFCNPTDKFYIGEDGGVYVQAVFGEGACSFLLVIPAFYTGNAVWWIRGLKVDLYSGSSDTYGMQFVGRSLLVGGCGTSTVKTTYEYVFKQRC